MEKNEKDTWISRAKLEQAVMACSRFLQHPDVLEDLLEILNTIEVRDGSITFTAEWEKVKLTDPDMDATERMLFPDETYRCSNCRNHTNMGASCTKDAYCQKCGARMLNAGRRK